MAASLLTFSSCGDFLDEEPKGQLTPDNFFNSEDDLTASVNALYDRVNQTQSWTNPMYPQWQGDDITANPGSNKQACAALDAFASDGGTCSRTLAIQAPTLAILAVPNNRSSAWRSPSKLRLSLSENPAEWSFPESLEPATLTFGWDWLPKLRQGIAGIPHGEGDYSIGGSGSSNLQLWFWWQPAAAA